MVGLYTSERTPLATVNQTFEVVLRAVPMQSLRARSKCDRAPGPSAAAVPCAAATGTAPGANVATASKAAEKALMLKRRPLMPPPLNERGSDGVRTRPPGKHSIGCQ